ncbi:guanylate kinase [Micromonospora sp. NPDC003197]
MSTVDDARPAARLTALVGPSGVGKGGVVELIRARSSSVWISIPVTTRPIREHEVDGVDRFFVDRAEFEHMIADGRLLDWTEIAGQLYGIPAEPIRSRLRAGQPVLLTTDLPGARRVRAAMPEARLVFLAPPATCVTRAHPVDSDRPAPLPREFDQTVVNEHVERAAAELVGLLGCSFPTPAQPRVRG